MKQSQPLRIEFPELASLGTCKTVRSQLWFVNNFRLEERILGYLGKYKQKFSVELYAFVLQGNHFHLCAKFPECNKSAFYRDLNARTAEAVKGEVKEFSGGALFARRYSDQALPLPEDIEERFFYCALQPVRAGLVERIQHYPGYNSFWDAINGRERIVKVVDYAAYNDKKRFNKKLRTKDFTREYRISFPRLPGYENLTQVEYRNLMLEKYEARRTAIVSELKARGHKFLTRKELAAIRPGSLPHRTKQSKLHDYRPLVLSISSYARKEFLSRYFSIYVQFKRACKRYLAGDALAEFPPGTYKPPGPFVPYASFT